MWHSKNAAACNEAERLRKKAEVDNFKVLFQHFLGETKGNDRNTCDRLPGCTKQEAGMLASRWMNFTA
jgi:hypothetical protein